MKEYMLIPKEELINIAKYIDAVADLFPTSSIPELQSLKSKVSPAFASAFDAGEKGQYHAKLDRIMDCVEFLAGRKELADSLTPALPFEPVVVRPNRFPLTQELKDDMLEKEKWVVTPEFDALTYEGGSE